MPSFSNTQESADELVSEDVKEIISYRPNWIVRKGNTFFMLILIIILSFTYFIQYPEIVNASARIIANNAPKLTTAKVAGKLQKLLVANGKDVEEGQALAYLSSTSDHHAVMKLHEWLIKEVQLLKNEEWLSSLHDPPPQSFQLGDLQMPFEEFYIVRKETEQLVRNGFYAKKKAALQMDLNYINQVKKSSFQQKELLSQDELLQQKEFEAYQILEKEKVIAPLELLQYKSKLIAKQQSIVQADEQITNSEITRHNKQKELHELKKFEFDQQQKYYASLLSLKSEVESWLQQYIIYAPEEGQVFYISGLQENQEIKNQEELFYIQKGKTDYSAEMLAAQKGLGKIKPGQQVILKLESYPSEEFGYIKGYVLSISGLPNRKDSFMIQVALTKGLKSNNGKQLYFRNQLKANAEIVTDERRLLNRFLGEFNKVFQRPS